MAMKETERILHKGVSVAMYKLAAATVAKAFATGLISFNKGIKVC